MSIDSIVVDDVELESVDEIVETSVENPGYEVPDKFKGKNTEDIIKSYVELEKTYGRQSQELGEYRKYADELLKQSIKPKETTVQQEPPKRVEFDDIVTDPDTAIGHVVEQKVKVINDKLNEYETKAKEEAQRKRAEKFVTNHPDFQDIGNSEEFKKFASASPYRARLLKQAETELDFEAADELLTEYKERQSYVKEVTKEKEDKRQKDLKKAVNESSSTGESSKKIYRRSELIRLRIENPDRFDALQDEIQLAYAEGRVK